MGGKGSGRPMKVGRANVVQVKRHHFGSKHQPLYQEVLSTSKLIADPLGHVARIVRDGERFLIESS